MCIIFYKKLFAILGIKKLKIVLIKQNVDKKDKLKKKTKDCEKG